jgi:Histidinol-phosphate/aromatic aminotransferase and cobyric acid decarboxylase
MGHEHIKHNLKDNKIIRPFGWDSEPRNKELLWLDKNENTDSNYINFISNISKDITSTSLNTYPEPKQLYIKLSNWVGIDKRSLIITPGSDGAIKSTFDVFIAKDDKVVITNPTFAMYNIYCSMYEANVFKIDYVRDQNRISIPIDKLLKYLKTVRPKLFCLPNPDSPTGAVFNDDEIFKIIQFCNENNIIILIDEAYHPYYKKSYSYLVSNYKNLIIKRTFSKAMGPRRP